MTMLSLKQIESNYGKKEARLKDPLHYEAPSDL